MDDKEEPGLGFGPSTEERQKKEQPNEASVALTREQQFDGAVSANKEQQLNGPSKLSLMTLNDNKAGMTGLDKERISAIIEKASKGSKFYAKQQETQARIDGQIAQLRERLAALSDKDLLSARQEADLYLEQLLAGLDLSRTIVHVDMDMFYAAIEMRDNPELRNKPMAVGGMGMLSTSNYAARKFGVRAAMPGFIGKKLCPELILVPGNMKKYAEEAQVIREVFREYDENFSPMSLDEAYMDLTDYLQLNPQTNPWDAVQEMRKKIEERTRLTASAGIAPNTFLAKVCSDLNKPNGQFMLEPNQTKILEFVRNLSIRKASGIGNISEQMLNGLGVKKCEDLFLKRAEIKLLFSKISFQFYMQISQGMGGTRLEPPDDRVQKSISTETTFKDEADRSALIDICEELSRELSEDMAKKEILGSAVTIKIKTHDFKIKTKVRQLVSATNMAEVIFAAAKQLLVQLLDQSEEQPLALRLMGVRMSELKSRSEVKSRQSTLSSFIHRQTNDSSSLSTKDRERSSSSLADKEQGCSSCLPDLEHGSSSSYLQNQEMLSCPICSQEVRGLLNLNNHIDAGCEQQVTENTDAPSSSSVTSSIDRDCIESVPADKSCPSIVSYCNQDNGRSDKVEETNNSDTSKRNSCSSPTSKKARESPSKSLTPSDLTGNSPRDFAFNAPSVVDETRILSQNSLTNSETTALTCPVCFKESLSSEADLNRHIDVCLNRSEIVNILKETNSAAGSTTANTAVRVAGSSGGSARVAGSSDGSAKRKSDTASSEPKTQKKIRLQHNKIDSYFKRT